MNAISARPGHGNFNHDAYDPADLEAVSSPTAGAIRMDAGEAMFFSRQLDYVKSRTYDRLYPALAGLRMVPITSDVPSNAETFSYRAWDKVGMAKLIANYSQDLPRVDVLARETTVKLRDIGDSYGYNIREIRAAQYANVAIDAKRAEAARRGIELKLNQLALTGDANVGLVGMLNHPNIGTVTVTGGWATATSDQILADLNAMYNGVITQSNNIHQPNTLVLPPVLRSILFQRYVGSTAVTTIGQFFMGQMSSSLGGANFAIETAVELSAAFSPTGANMAVVYERSEDNMSLEVPERFEQHPAQQRVLEWVVPCTARVGGFVLYRPLSILTASGL